ncbi:MAG: hypothetical protein MPN21_23730 [Thermoanaerobaculia bacterium]|nr:hypothetical protein [Thermoanaerobaculia bacterium]
MTNSNSRPPGSPGASTEPSRKPLAGSRLLAWLAPITALGVFLLPTLWFGFPRGHDWLLELTRIAEYRHALAEGQLPPFWAPNVYGGQGAPVFVFYSPLFLAVASAATTLLAPFLTNPVPAAATVTIWGFALAGVLSMVDLFRSLGAGGAGARVGALLLVLHPYFLTDALLRNANAEFAALCLLPQPLAGVVCIATGGRGGTERLSLGLAAVILAHNLTALVAAPTVALLGVVLLWDGERRDQVRFVLATASGLLLSAWLWLPALGYRHLIRQTELTKGHLDFHGNFTPVFGWSGFSSVGYLPLLTLFAGFVWMLVARPKGLSGRVAWTLAGASAMFLFLQTPVSTQVWEALPFLPLFQFPWRFQGPLALSAAVLAGLAWSRIARDWKPSRILLVEWSLLLLLVLNAWPHLSNVRPLPDEARQELASRLTPEGIRNHGLKVTVGNEYLPAERLDPASLPYGPDREPALRTIGVLLAAGTALFALLRWLRRARRLEES